ncbi:MAG: hypothetical protein QOE36_2443 [Gaiellaceae bacterium]|jgi:cell division protein FtsB|nr:hypothetical protein [Gaiellaceae bacterium]
MASSTTRSRTPSRAHTPAGRPGAAARKPAAAAKRAPAPARRAAPKRRARAARSRLFLRWLAVGGVALAAFLYVRPLRAYLHTRATLHQRTEQVRYLQREHSSLERRVAASRSAAALEREARRLGYVKPGERLYIVKGIQSWRRAQHAATMRRGG